MFAETLAVFLFVLLILTLKYFNGSKELVVNAFCVALALYACVGFASVSGGGMNPAVVIS